MNILYTLCMSTLFRLPSPKVNDTSDDLVQKAMIKRLMETVPTITRCHFTNDTVFLYTSQYIPEDSVALLNDVLNAPYVWWALRHETFSLNTASIQQNTYIQQARFRTDNLDNDLLYADVIYDGGGDIRLIVDGVVHEQVCDESQEEVRVMIDIPSSSIHRFIVTAKTDKPHFAIQSISIVFGNRFLL